MMIVGQISSPEEAKEYKGKNVDVKIE